MPRKILHIVGSMNRGGVETWLMGVFRNIDRSRYQMDVAVHSLQPGSYDQELKSMGATILHCPYPSRPWSYVRRLRKLLREHGPYDVVHSHIHHYSGLVLLTARRAGVPVRIAHSHNDLRPAEVGARLPRRFYLALTERWIKRHATRGFACSMKAAESLFGSDWEQDSRWKILYYGVDLPTTERMADREELRREFNIPRGACVVGHVGRFDKQKNHTFLVKIAAELVRSDPNVFVLLVGDGSLRADIEAQVRTSGIVDNVRFALVRPDVFRLMNGAMDVLLFPSLHEGLGLVLVEAQAAGLPCVCSDVVPDEAFVIPELVTKLSLNLPASTWAEAVLARKDQPRPVSQDLAFHSVMKSRFSQQEHLAELCSEYAV
jgi:glycosyltransferase involved in cell wall biosynthesis